MKVSCSFMCVLFIIIHFKDALAQSYCFQFTWVGPNFDNSSNLNTTYEEHVENTCISGIPCRYPLVYTEDGSPPNIDYLWENHRESILCRQSKGEVCAKYSYYFNSQLQNVTFMCTKVVVVGEGGSPGEGCYKQIINEHEVELCVCESQKDSYKPCNSGMSHSVSVEKMLMLVLLSMLIANYPATPG